MTKILPDDVDHIARLAHLLLSPEEVARLAVELTAIIGYVEKLNASATDEVPPTLHAAEQVNATREDIFLPEDAATIAALLRAAPEQENGGIKVPAVLRE